MLERRRGLIYGLSAYLLWGIFPLYFPLLEPTTPLEILAHRIVWSLVVLLIVLTVTGRWSWIKPLLRDRRRMVLLPAAAITIAINWGVYIFGVNSEQVVQTSLGYFINPLVSVLFGVVVFKERLRAVQWAAVGLGGVAVIVLTVAYGGLPWIALTLAVSFGTYGLLKKTLDMGAVESLSAETAILTPVAAAYLGFLLVNGSSAMATDGPQMAALLASLGVITVIPLLFFGAAATRIPLTWIGLLQYSAPILQFLIGVFVYNEPMPASRWVGFAFVWSALVILVIDSMAAVHRGRTQVDLEIDARAQEAH
ncbi:MAG: EamA family transporter RarD [Actinomycetia bacterium]|nr:EamA family transporter RarD [Actinomycetes bacterium]